jgi:hypothetical protein
MQKQRRSSTQKAFYFQMTLSKLGVSLGGSWSAAAHRYSGACTRRGGAGVGCREIHYKQLQSRGQKIRLRTSQARKGKANRDNCSKDGSVRNAPWNSSRRWGRRRERCISCDAKTWGVV